jgi:hypothetical protein
MTSRDFAWRCAGAAILALAGAIGPGHLLGTGGASGLLAFVTALLGLVLLVQGRRVPAALRIERSRHRALPQSLHRRVTQGRRRSRVPTP